MATLPTDLVNLIELFVTLSEKLGALNTSISTWQAAQEVMMTALAETNTIVAQINALNFGINIPSFSAPINVDPAWVQSILDNAAQVRAQGDALKSAIL